MKYITRTHLLGLMVIAVFGLAGVTVWSSVKSNIDRVTIENKTNSLLVESVKDLTEDDDFTLIEITLKNNSTRDIVSLRFLKIGEFDNKGDIRATVQGGLELDWSLKPNETIKQKIPIAAPVGKVKVIIAAVLFADGTGDGIGNDILSLQEDRMGVYMAYQKIVPMFEKVVNSDNDFVSDESLQTLEKSIKQLNDDDVPANSKGGFYTARGYFGSEIEDIRSNKIQNSQYRAKTKMKDKLSKMKTKLAKFSADGSFIKKKEQKGGQDEN